jgi:hypothetical protein
MALSVAVVTGDKLRHLDVIAGLLTHLAHHRSSGGIQRVGPPPGRGPAPIGALLHKQHPLLRVEHHRSDIDLRRDVTAVASQLHPQFLIGAVAEHREQLDSQPPDLLIADDVEGVLSERKTVLTNGGQCDRHPPHSFSAGHCPGSISRVHGLIHLPIQPQL